MTPKELEMIADTVALVKRCERAEAERDALRAEVKAHRLAALPIRTRERLVDWVGFFDAHPTSLMMVHVRNGKAFVGSVRRTDHDGLVFVGDAIVPIEAIDALVPQSGIG